MIPGTIPKIPDGVSTTYH